MPHGPFNMARIRDFFANIRADLAKARPKDAIFGMSILILAIICFVLMLDIVMVAVRAIAALTV